MHQKQKTFSFRKDNYAFALWPVVFVMIFKRATYFDGVYGVKVSKIVFVIRFLRLGIEIKIDIN